MKYMDDDVKVNNVCPRCGTIDGDLTVDGIKFECYDERHDDLLGLVAREAGVLAAEQYLAKRKRSYVRGAVDAVRDIARLVVGGGR